MTGPALLLVLLVAPPLSAGVSSVTSSVSGRADAVATGTARQQLLSPERPPGDGDVAIREVRLQAVPEVESSPAVRVTLQLHNASERDITGLVIRVCLVAAKPKSQDRSGPAVIAAPLSIRMNSVLLANHSMNYDIVLRNVSADGCECVPAVTVLNTHGESP
jgi:hypothetical protein